MPELDYTDSQEQSEIFDEDNQNLDGEGQTSPMELRTFEDMPDVLDLTADKPVSDAVPVFDRAEGSGSDGRAEAADDIDRLGDEAGAAGGLASLEGDTVSDEDLVALGYSDIGPDGEAHARRS